MSQTPAPVPDPSQPQPQSQASPERPPEGMSEPSADLSQLGTRPVPPHDSPNVQTPAADMALAAAEGLTENQRTVMSHLAAGYSIAKAARSAKLSRRTVHRWLEEDVEFCAVYNAWRRELERSARSRLLAICDDAIDTLHNAILAGNVQASLSVAKSIGVMTKSRIGSPDPARVAQRRRVRQMRRAAADIKAVDRARSDLPDGHPLRYTPDERAQMEEADRKRQEEYEKQQKEQEPKWRKRFRQGAEAHSNDPVDLPPQAKPDSIQPAEADGDSTETPDSTEK